MVKKHGADWHCHRSGPTLQCKCIVAILKALTKMTSKPHKLEHLQTLAMPFYPQNTLTPQRGDVEMCLKT